MIERKFTPPTTFPAEYVTRHGRKAFIVSEIPDDDYPYLGYYIGDEGECWPDIWTKEGLIVGEGCEPEERADDLFDIVQEPPKKVRWINDYGTILPINGWYSTRKDADDNARNGRIAVIRREWVEGQLPQYFTEGV